MKGTPLDILVVGAGPTGIAIGAQARRAGLEVILVDKGPLTASIQGYPTDMQFFTTRDLLEIADVPFTIPEAKPSRQQALAYYRGVAQRYSIPLALHEEVLEVQKDGGGGFFSVTTRRRGMERTHCARAVVLATGYFDGLQCLGVPGEDLPWVRHRYLEPYGHYSEHVAVVGGGNSAVEAALELWRAGARVTLVHRGVEVKSGVKYWLKPDLANRIQEGNIGACLETTVNAFVPGGMELEGPRGSHKLEVDWVYVLVGYVPDVDLQRRCGVQVDPGTLIPDFDPDSCESNVPGLYIAGSLQAGRRTDKIFIENSREHAPLIVNHFLDQQRPQIET